jgi:hypothetical protein
MDFLEQLIEIEKKSSTILGKRPTPIYLFETESDVTAGGYIPEEEIIILNSKFQELTSTVISFIAHESRHAYQDQVIKRYIEPKSLDDIDAWHRELNNPIHPSTNDTQDPSFIAYATQSIEIDALAYSELFIQKVLKKRQHIWFPEYLKESVKKRKDEIENMHDFDIEFL